MWRAVWPRLKSATPFVVLSGNFRVYFLPSLSLCVAILFFRWRKIVQAISKPVHTELIARPISPVGAHFNHILFRRYLSCCALFNTSSSSPHTSIMLADVDTVYWFAQFIQHSNYRALIDGRATNFCIGSSKPCSQNGYGCLYFKTKKNNN